MNTFFKNYWSLFIDFIKDFQDVKFKEIPLPILSVFHFYLDDDLKRQLREESFGKILKTKIEYENQMQPNFDLFLSKITKKNSEMSDSSKLLIHDGDLLRFPEAYLQTFDKRKTEYMFSAKMRKSKTWHDYVQNLKKSGKVHMLDDYREDNQKLMNQYLTQINSLFVKYKDHPVYGNQYFQNKFLEELPLMVDLLVAYDNFFSKVPISCVIVGNTLTLYSRILTLIANSKGITTICMQHGIHSNELCYFPIIASKHAVYGHYDKEWYLKRRVSSQSIEIIGHPRFDEIFTKKHMPKRKFMQKLGISSKKKLVFVATNIDRDINVWSTFIRELQKSPSITIIVKPHHTEERLIGTKDFTELSSKYPSVKLVPAATNLYDIIANVDIVVQEYTTVGLEAMLFGKPVFNLRKKDYYNVNDRYYFDQLAEFSDVDPLAVVKMINNFLQDIHLQTEIKLKQKQFLSFVYPQSLSGNKLHDLLHKVNGPMLTNVTADNLVEKSLPTNVSDNTEVKGSIPIIATDETEVKKKMAINFTDGMIVKGTGCHIYLIHKGKKCHITSPKIFRKLGCTAKDVKIIRNNILETIPNGPNITPDNLSTFIKIKMKH